MNKGIEKFGKGRKKRVKSAERVLKKLILV